MCSSGVSSGKLKLARISILFNETVHSKQVNMAPTRKGLLNNQETKKSDTDDLVTSNNTRHDKKHAMTSQRFSSNYRIGNRKQKKRMNSEVVVMGGNVWNSSRTPQRLEATFPSSSHDNTGQHQFQIIIYFISLE